MDLRRAAETIKETVSMDQILSLYGYRVKHGGFMPCPFHGEKNASLRVYKGTGGWHCFGCGRGGSVIDFVMEQEGCDFRVAVLAIDQALNLRLLRETGFDHDADRRHIFHSACDEFAKATERYLDAKAWEIEARQAVRLHAVQAAEEKKLTAPETMTADDYMTILTWRDESEWDDYQMEKIEKLRKEVSEWRRKARKTG